MPAKIKKTWTPRNWAGLAPFGIGRTRPNNFAEVFRAAWENRDRLGYAWRILNDGVCDGCALGTTGLRDWTLDGVHLCNIRLRLLRLNTASPMDAGLLSDVKRLEGMSSAQMRELGRLPHPMIRRAGEQGFHRASWDAALDLIAGHLSAAPPDEIGFYLTSRGTPNETYYAAQKAARALGTNNIDNAARVCHSPSTTALKGALGVAATTCSYSDWMSADLIVFIGSNVANNQPVATKYLHYAKKNGARIAVINNMREPGMERYWIPSVPESAFFGTRLADRFFLINIGGDVAFLNGALKHMIASGTVEEDFLRDHTAGFDDLRRALEGQSWERLERAAGAGRVEMQAFAQMVAEARRAVFVWSMGITQHECGVENVRAIINVALSRGFVGREGCGLMPIRGHSGVQGGAEMGCYTTAFPGGRSVNAEEAARLAEMWGFDVPHAPGLDAVEMIEAAHAGRMRALVSMGGNFLEVLPDPAFTGEALRRVPLRVHMDIVASPQMLAEAAEAVVLLPAMTRYEIPGGVTETSTERRVIFSPEIPGPRVDEARAEWDVFLEMARRARPELKRQLAFRDTAAIRAEIARVIPFYAGIEKLRKKGDQFQYGGPHLCASWKFPTSDGRAHFAALEPRVARTEPGENEFLVTTRRGKQFNSMVHEKRDAITGAAREAVLMNPPDAKRLGLRGGDRVTLKNEFGIFSGRVRLAPVAPGNLQIHWPEGNVLLDRSRRAPQAGVPDYNAAVTVEKM